MERVFSALIYLVALLLSYVCQGVSGTPLRDERLEKENQEPSTEVEKEESGQAAKAPSLKVLIELTLNGTCANAIDFARYGHILEKKGLVLSRSRVFTNEDPPSLYSTLPRKLSLINAGAGSTGTSEIYEIMCNGLHVRAFHSPWHCGVKKLDDLTIMFGRVHDIHLDRITQARAEALLRRLSAGKVKNRNPHVLLERFYKERIVQLSHVFFVTDSPVAEVLHELLLLSKQNSGLMLTLREPHDWAIKRITSYGNSLICRKQLWDNPDVLHPFDYIGCFIASKKHLRGIKDDGYTVEGAFTTILDHALGRAPFGRFGQDFTEEMRTQLNSTRVKEVEQAFVQMNTVNWLLAEKMGKPVLPICLWDERYNKGSEKLYHTRQHDITSLLITPFLSQNKIQIQQDDQVRAGSMNQYPHGKPKGFS